MKLREILRFKPARACALSLQGHGELHHSLVFDNKNICEIWGEIGEAQIFQIAGSIEAGMREK